MMNLKLKKPLAFFDLETTGINISQDRIVEICILKVFPDEKKEVKTWRINPEIPIPASVSKVHGIYDADVKDCPTFKMLAIEIFRFFDGCDLSGFNLVKFDVPLLVEEFLRAGHDFDVSNRKIVDVQRIFHTMEPRSLSAAYRFYCSKTLENAHSAEADTLATFEVLDAQLARYEGQNMPGDKNSAVIFENDIASLSKLSLSNQVDFAGRMVFNDKGQEIFNFGKHKDKLVLDVLKSDPSYYDWIQKGEFSMDTKRRLTEIKLRGFGKS
ncbi:MAG TPA: DNA polymerase III subunit epsilon [Cytophagales bacterium]|nr:DNA polymerase III subunit epsilon [Cytophagales bacterium]